MDEIHNGISAADLLNVVWLKSRASGQLGNCVEIAHLPGGRVALRNSRDPYGPTLVHTSAEHAALLVSVKKW